MMSKMQTNLGIQSVGNILEQVDNLMNAAARIFVVAYALEHEKGRAPEDVTDAMDCICKAITLLQRFSRNTLDQKNSAQN